MTVKKQRLGSDLARAAAHFIQPHEYDEAPEFTAADVAKADHYLGEVLVRRGRGRPKLAAPKALVSVRLDSDVLERFRQTGPGWQARLNAAAREWLDRKG